MISEKSDTPFRVVTIGDESVGKTSLTSRLVNNKFNPYEPGTIGANYQQYNTIIDGININIQIWDTAGQEKFKSLSPIYFRNSSAAIIVFSLTNRSTFNRLNEWITTYKEVAGHESIIYIAANKSDLINEYQIGIEEVKEWAKINEFPIFITSAKDGIGINEIFENLSIQLLKSKESKSQKVHTKPIDDDNNSDKCC